MKRTKYAVISAIAIFSLPGHALESIVSTQYGRLRGSGSAVVSFKGIPYAAPPTGRLRWRPPEGPTEWQGVRDATGFGPICPQPRTPRVPTMAASENCLTLNVWTPARS